MEITTGSIQFLQPQWFWLLIILGLIPLWRHFYSVGDEKTDIFSQMTDDAIRVHHPLIDIMPAQSKNRTSSTMRALVLWLVLILTICALATPIRIGKKIPDPPKYKDIVLIIDTSVSMLLRDYMVQDQRIDRMRMLKTVLDQFVDQFQGNRFALVVYGESAHTYVPFTGDNALVRRMLARIKTTMAGRFNAVGDAIRLAVDEVLKTSQQSAILVLFSAVNQATGEVNPLSAAAISAQAKLPLYTVAIGATTGKAEERRNAGLIYDAVNWPLLQAMAQATGAQSYHAGDVVALQRIVEDIKQRQVQPTQPKPRYFQQALYYWPLLFAILLLGSYHCFRVITVCIR